VGVTKKKTKRKKKKKKKERAQKLTGETANLGLLLFVQ